MTAPEVATDGRRSTGAHAAELALVFAALLAWTWGRWPDVLVDFGRELYVPWQIVEGKQLYTEIAWFNGPLSPYWNAAMFRVFGIGLSTLVWVNAALFALTIALLHHVLRSFGSRDAATKACLAVMAICGFGQLVGIGNYNYICPYSHEMTHGMLLGIAALSALEMWHGRRSIVWVLGAGLCVGATFLTKPEMFVAALAGAIVAVTLHCWSVRLRTPRAIAAFSLGLLTPVVSAWALLCVPLGSDAAWRATLGAWPSLWSSGVANLPFYQFGMGIDAPAYNVVAMLEWALGILGVLALIFGLTLWATNEARRRTASILAPLFSLGMLIAFHASWFRAARPWPLFAFLALVYSVTMTLRHRGISRWRGAAAFSAFALAMLAKMLLNARLIQYGFALAMPATALIAVALCDWLPERLERAGRASSVFRSGAFVLLAGFVAIHLGQTAVARSIKTIPIGSGRDVFLGDFRTTTIAQVVDWISGGVPPGGPCPTLAVVPEGVTINYLARLENPTPYVNFMPPELLIFGEANILNAFREHPPDFVLVTHKDTSEYGVRWFGVDYARDLRAWLKENYEPAALFGDEPLTPGSTFGIRVLRRR